MKKSILLAGFGGQGVLFAGKLLATCAMMEGKHVSWMPAYGPEMRGGTANCAVNISDEEIGSPQVTKPDILIALNQPSYDKFEGSVVKGGLIVADSGLVDLDNSNKRDDVTLAAISATKLANENELQSLANIISVGQMLKHTDLFPIETIEKAIDKIVPASKGHLIVGNKKAVAFGKSL